MRRTLTTALGLLLAIVAVALLIAGASGMFHGRMPPDTLAANASQAEDVAFSVASNAGCGAFDSELPEVSADSWQFECTIGDVLYRIFVYGSDRARSDGLAQLQADSRPYVSRAFYAVTAVPFGASKDEVLNATAPPSMVMDPFR